MNVKLGLLSGPWRALWTPHISCLLCPCPPKGTCVASGARAALPCFLIIFCSANICFCRTEGACVRCFHRLLGYCEGPLDNVWPLKWWEKPKSPLHFTLTQSCGSSASMNSAETHIFHCCLVYPEEWQFQISWPENCNYITKHSVSFLGLFCIVAVKSDLTSWISY